MPWETTGRFGRVLVGFGAGFTAQTRYKKSWVCSGFFGRVLKCIYSELGERGFGMGWLGRTYDCTTSGHALGLGFGLCFQFLGRRARISLMFGFLQLKPAAIKVGPVTLFFS